MKFITIPNVLKKNKLEELVIVVSGAKLGSDMCRDMFELNMLWNGARFFMTFQRMKGHG